MAQTILDLMRDHGYWLLAVLLCFETAGLPFLPGEITLFTASFVAYRGDLNVFIVCLIAILAVFIGQLIGYYWGHRAGNKFLLKHPHIFRIDETRLLRISAYFARHGGKTIFFARWIAVLRALSSPLAGAAGMKKRVFVSYAFLGSIVWSTAITFIAYAAGPAYERVASLMGTTSAILLAIVVVSVIGLTIHRKLRV